MDAQIDPMRINSKSQGSGNQSNNNNLDEVSSDSELNEQASLFKTLLNISQGNAKTPVNSGGKNGDSASLSVSLSQLSQLSPSELKALLSSLQNQEGMSEILASIKETIDAKEKLQGSQQNAGDALLSQLVPNTLQSLDANFKSDSASLSSEHRIASMVDTVAQRILVSNPDLSGKQEVMLVLKPDVLAGAQVKLSRDDAGLQVVFQTNVKDSANFLFQNQTALQNFLGSRLDGPVHVKVEEVYTTAQQADSGQNEGQSKGQYIPEPEEA